MNYDKLVMETLNKKNIEVKEVKKHKANNGNAGRLYVHERYIGEKVIIIPFNDTNLSIVWNLLRLNKWK